MKTTLFSMSGRMARIEGFPVFIPNDIEQGKNFYISFNASDSGAYGSATTALVKDDMTKFLVLNGDHRKEYFQLIPAGYQNCVDYFKKNIEHVNKYSEEV